jgi:alanine dehydrogenase
MTLMLNRSEVMSLLSMEDCIGAVEDAFRELARGTAVLPLRIAIAPPDGFAFYMPAYLKEMEALACKVVSVYKKNPVRRALPTTIGTVLLQNPDTGEVVCIMDGTYLTAVRTGAVCGVATKYLARTDRGQTCAVFGAGAQARMQLWAMATVRDLAKALVYDVSDVAADTFVSEMNRKLCLPISRAGSPEEALDADIICTATCSDTPVFPGLKVREGTHINAVGGHSPDARELDSDIVKRSKFVGDLRESCLTEAGDIIIPLREGLIPKSHFYAELGELVAGTKKGRASDSEITLFRTVGIAIQDAAAAKLVYKRAIKEGIGITVEI